MSQENVELLNRAYDALNRRDIDAMLALSDPDLEFTPLLLELEGGGPYRGHDGVRRWWEDLLGVFPDYSIEMDEVRDLGNVTVARVRGRGHGVESDVFTEQTFWQVTEWRHMKAVWWHNFLSEAEALEAAGLRK
jgi:ketosteroid isomerase-like protein